MCFSDKINSTPQHFSPSTQYKHLQDKLCYNVGLDADCDKILEVACIITDENLNIIEEVHFNF